MPTTTVTVPSRPTAGTPTPTVSAVPSATGAARHTRAIPAIVLVSYFMILLDDSIIFTALPKLHTAMRYSTTWLAWVQDCSRCAWSSRSR
ncbi:hypothetical protein [Catenulispora subtropica]|uniref:hypothetical protein n=1 Tax=Catenulispora subtropica TaxID=450798 RepID=UPI0031CDEFD8